MKAVLFDCDGVLINSEELGAKVLKDTFNKHGLNYTAEERLEKFSGLSYGDLKKTVEKDYQAIHGKPVPEDFFEKLNEEYRKVLQTEIAAIDGVVELLKTLRQEGIPFAVASNGDHIQMEAKLRATGLYDLVAPHIYSKDDVANPKPAPDVFTHAAAKLGVDPHECVVVEDSQVGMIAAAASGGYALGHANAAFAGNKLGIALQKAGADEIHPSMQSIKDRIFDIFDISGPTFMKIPDFPQP